LLARGMCGVDASPAVGQAILRSAQFSMAKRNIIFMELLMSQGKIRMTLWHRKSKSKLIPQSLVRDRFPFV